MRRTTTAILTVAALLVPAWSSGDAHPATPMEALVRVSGGLGRPVAGDPASASPTTAPIATTALPDDEYHHPPDEPFWSRVRRVSRHPVRHRMRGVSWHPGCPVPLRDLRFLRLPFVRFDGSAHAGSLVVHASAVPVVRQAMRRLYTMGYPIRRMRLVHHYDGDDDRSMAANNTSAFNCRRVAGSDTWSRHAYGTAIDINPRQNPYRSSSGHVAPAEGRRFVDRSNRRPGMLYRRLGEVRAFTDRGWGWGGDWQSSKDWQHFSADGH